MSGSAPHSDAARLSAWLKKQPGWFSCALHLALKGDWSAEDIDDLAAAACEEAGFALPIGHAGRTASFQEADAASLGMSARQVVLEAVTAVANVNALIDGAAITFAREGLTVVYGENGAGKSGFSRLIRNTCTSRAGTAPILSNVFEESASPQAVYDVRIDGAPASFTWSAGMDDPPRFPEIMFFDADCATAELQGRQNEVLYVPPAVSALERLSALIGEVSARLRSYSEQLPAELSDTAVPDFARASYDVAPLLESDDPRALRASLTAVRLSENDVARMRALPALIEGNPDTEAPKLRARAEQLADLRGALAELYRACDAGFAREYAAALEDLKLAEEAAKAARHALAGTTELDGVGEGAWKALWEAARAYSETAAYPHEHFPFLGTDAACPLCQQPLSKEAEDRLAAFDRFAASAAESALSQRAEAVSALRATFLDAVGKVTGQRASVPIVEDANARDLLLDLMDDLAGVADVPSEHERAALLGKTLTAGAAVRSEIDALGARLASFEAHGLPGAADALQQEFRELRARAWAAENEEGLLACARARELQGQIARVRKSCSTRAISSLVANISQTEVVESLQTSFAIELAGLQASDQPIALKARTQSGREYQELVLDGALGKAKSAQVLSAGERQIAALAGFFALLDVVQGGSTAVFDDPADSLDRTWKESSALRIVVEARKRPIVVFTHDLPFCNLLSRQAAACSVPVEFRTILRTGGFAGCIRNGLAWDAADATERIRMLQDAAATLRTRLANDEFEDEGTFEREMGACYSHLRAAWEQAIEEVLLDRAVERSAPGVRTQRLRHLVDITAEDVDAAESNLRRCDAVIEACDDPSVASTVIPGVQELERDIATLAEWIAAIRARRLG